MQNQPITRPVLSLAVILIGSFMAPLLMHSSTLAIPAIAAELHLDAEQVSWFTLLNILGNACFVLPAGKLADIYGRLRIFSIGIMFSTVSCVVGGLAFSPDMILAGRLMQGIAGAFIFGSSIALVNSIPPEEKKAKVMGIYIGIVYIGMVAGPLFGGAVVEYLHWRWVFFIPAIFFVLTSIAGMFFLHWERYGDRKTKVRLLDTTLYMSSLVLIAVAVFKTSELSGQLLLLSGVLFFAGFIWFQNKRKDPLLQVALFKGNPVYSILSATHFFTYCGILSLPFTATLYLQYIKGISAQTTGLILIAPAVFTATISPLAGWLVSKIRVRILLVMGMSAIMLAMSIFAFISPDMPIWVVVLALSLVGLGTGLMDTQLVSVCMASVEDKLLGSASATLNGLRTLGGLVGVGIVSYLMGVGIGKQPITPEIYPELMSVLEAFFKVSAVLTFFGVLSLFGGIYIRARKQARAKRA